MSWIHFYIIILQKWFIDLLQNSLFLSTHTLFGLGLDSFKIFGKALVIVIPFLSFKGIIHVYLLNKSITHNKYLNPLLNLLINDISAGSAPQILSIKDECIFIFSNFLVIGNSSAYSLLDIISFIIVPAEQFLSNNL